MILRATFENIYSIKDETQISFVAGKSNAHPSHVSRAEKRDDISVLKAGIVYGANLPERATSSRPLPCSNR